MLELGGGGGGRGVGGFVSCDHYLQWPFEVGLAIGGCSCGHRPVLGYSLGQSCYGATAMPSSLSECLKCVFRVLRKDLRVDCVYNATELQL